MIQDWFTDAKLGIFIHWGVYAVGRRGSESWPLFRAKVSYDQYLSEMEKFDASHYDAEGWAELVERSGAKYAVLTTKHHDGVALWPTKQDGPSIPNRTGLPDLVKPFLNAIRGKGIRSGLYFSHTDWHHLDHMRVLTGKTEAELIALRAEEANYGELRDEMAKDPERAHDAQLQACWKRFLAFHRAQLREILSNYGPIDLIWFDVMMNQPGFDYPTAELRDFIHSIHPRTVINSRLGKDGDYETPEQFIPVFPPKGPWELCMTTNNTWSYTGREENYKTPFEILLMFCECLGMGGNLLLNIGPDEHGVVPPQQVELLETLGDWVKKHAEAVYGTVRGLPHGYAYGFSSLNKTGDTLYLYLTQFPKGGTPVKGIKNDVKRVTVLGEGTECGTKRVGGARWLGVPGTLWIDVPAGTGDEYITVLKIELDGPLNLYGGQGVEIDAN
jgi:alpha-L-fucosidase